MEFEWSEEKNTQNKKKHGRYLSEAITLWEGNGNKIVAANVIGDEKRFVISGFIDEDFWISPFCYRYEGKKRKVRIISFYRKDKKEASKYGW